MSVNRMDILRPTYREPARASNLEEWASRAEHTPVTPPSPALAADDHIGKLFIAQHAVTVSHCYLASRGMVAYFSDAVFRSRMISPIAMVADLLPDDLKMRCV